MKNTPLHIYERQDKGKVLFYLTYTINGQRKKERLPIPPIPAGDRYALEEARAVAASHRYNRMKQLKEGWTGISIASDLLLSDWLRLVGQRAEQRKREGVHRHTWGRTIADTARIIEQWRGNRVLLSQIDKAFLLDFVLHLRHGLSRPLAESTIAKRFDCLAFALKEATREGLIATNPCTLLQRGERPHAPASTRAFLTADELHRLIATPAPDDRTRNIYLFACFTGLRISDLLTLRWDNIERDGDRLTLRIRQHKTQQPITIPLSTAARQFLPPPTGDLVFADHITEQAMNNQLKRWARSAGINKRLTLHTARHTFATLLLSQGVDIYTTSKLLGHSNVSVTQIYAKVVDKQKEAAIDTLDNLLK